ncbi:hypothetical protein F5Y16DRAFT_414716 [Xylariaceae sp. FL0255]|nr:hypothetical protein F5Y16DRAFT_414716 [Xylariaceae sp. FL0255]
MWLKVSIVLLMIDSIIELSLISSMVGWLDLTASQSAWQFTIAGATYSVSGLPKKLIVDHGHTSNGAAGTAFVVVALGGLLALCLRHVSDRREGRGRLAAHGSWWYHAWLSLSILALFLTTGALAYVFALANLHAGQRIDTLEVASLNSNSPYSLLSWTPQAWLSAVLRLDLVRRRREIRSQLAIMNGWQYNLIVMFLIQLSQTVLALVEYFSWRNHRRRTMIPMIATFIG